MRRVTGCILFRLVNDGKRQGTRSVAVWPCATPRVVTLSIFRQSRCRSDAGDGYARFKRLYTLYSLDSAGTLLAVTTNDNKQDEENQHKRETVEAAVEDTH
ncbi:hypothetical protein QO009_001995 [Brevibacillus aydinogluensis]|jgi:hypothetical protein|nr:hypothetical protein [Brevibacillus aydinogluensis]